MINTKKSGLATDLLHSLLKRNQGLKIALTLSIALNIITILRKRR